MISVYSDCINHELFKKIPDKNFYTKKDVNNLIVESLFCKSGTLLECEAIFMLKCKAISISDGTEHELKLSKFIKEYNYSKNEIKRMVL